MSYDLGYELGYELDAQRSGGVREEVGMLRADPLEPPTGLNRPVPSFGLNFDGPTTHSSPASPLSPGPLNNPVVNDQKQADAKVEEKRKTADPKLANNKLKGVEKTKLPPPPSVPPLKEITKKDIEAIQKLPGHESQDWKDIRTKLDKLGLSKEEIAAYEWQNRDGDVTTLASGVNAASLAATNKSEEIRAAQEIREKVNNTFVQARSQKIKEESAGQITEPQANQMAAQMFRNAGVDPEDYPIKIDKMLSAEFVPDGKSPPRMQQEMVRLKGVGNASLDASSPQVKSLLRQAEDYYDARTSSKADMNALKPAERAQLEQSRELKKMELDHGTEEGKETRKHQAAESKLEREHKDTERTEGEKFQKELEKIKHEYQIEQIGIQSAYRVMEQTIGNMQQMAMNVLKTMQEGLQQLANSTAPRPWDFVSMMLGGGGGGKRG